VLSLGLRLCPRYLLYSPLPTTAQPHTLSLHDALPISASGERASADAGPRRACNAVTAACLAFRISLSDMYKPPGTANSNPARRYSDPERAPACFSARSAVRAAAGFSAAERMAAVSAAA